MNIPQALLPKSSSNGFARRRGDREGGARLESKVQSGKSNQGRIQATGSLSGGKTGGYESSSRDRLVYMTTCLIGHMVEVHLKNGSIYSGIFHATDAEKDFGIVLKMARLVKDGTLQGNKAVTEFISKAPTKILIIPAKELVQVIAKDVAVTSDGFASELQHEKQQELLIDSVISQSRHFGLERELEPWVPDEDYPQCPELENIFSGSWNRNWDQFETNQKLFGVKSTFNEELYTTKLERGPQTRELEKEAMRIAREIEGEETRDLHLAEERGLDLHDNFDIDEEMRYSSVYRGRGFDDSGYEEEEDILLDSQNIETFGDSSDSLSRGPVDLTSLQRNEGVRMSSSTSFVDEAPSSKAAIGADLNHTDFNDEAKQLASEIPSESFSVSDSESRIQDNLLGEHGGSKDAKESTEKLSPSEDPQLSNSIDSKSLLIDKLDGSDKTVPSLNSTTHAQSSSLSKVSEKPSASGDLARSLTCQDQENGFILDDSVSTDPVETVSPDLSPEAGKGRDEFLVEEMAIKEVSRDEKLELKDEDDEAGNGLGTITTVMTDLPTGFGAKCNGELPTDMNSAKNDSLESENILVKASDTELEDKGMVLSQKGAPVEEESENGNAKQSHCQVQSAQEATEKPNGQGSEEGSKADDQSALLPQFMMNGRQNEKITCLLNADCDSNKDCQFLQAKILEYGHMVDASINHQKQQKDSQQEVQLVTDSSDTFFMDQMNNEESEEKKIIEEKKDSNPIENGKQCISQSYDPIEQMQGSDMAEVKHEPIWDLSEYPKPIPLAMIDTTPSPKQCSKQCANGETPQVVAIANGDYNNQKESVGRFSLESNPDTINSQMRKSPSFDLDLRIHARAEDSDQTPLLFQDKTTIESFSTQAEEKANTENGENPSQYESMATKEKAVTLERSDSEKSRTPFLGFLKEDEEEADEHNMLMEKNPKKQGNQSATNKTTTKVSTSVTTKGKVKRKPITAFFGTCMCCATVTN